MTCPVRAFLTDCTEEVDGASVAVSDLFKAFGLWCAERNIVLMARKSFGRKLRAVVGRPVPTASGHTIVLGRTFKEAPVSVRRPMLVLPAGLTADDVIALKMIAEERARQIVGERCRPEADDAYRFGELARAAGAYLEHAGCDPLVRASFQTVPPGIWPFPVASWKPKTPERDAVRGGALAVAFLASRLRTVGAAEG